MKTVCRSSVLFVSLLLVLEIAGGGSSVRADTSCTLPVCNIETEIGRLRGQTQNDRFQFVTQIETQFHSSQDPAVLANLRDFGQKAAALFQELHEADWLIRAARTIFLEGSAGLAKYARPVRANDLINEEGLKFD